MAHEVTREVRVYARDDTSAMDLAERLFGGSAASAVLIGGPTTEPTEGLFVYVVALRRPAPDELCVCGHLPEDHEEHGTRAVCLECPFNDEDDIVLCLNYESSGVPAADYREVAS